MKRTILLAGLLMSFAAYAADSKEEVTAAAKKLGDAANYSWKSTVKVPEDSQFKPGPTEGKADKDGTAIITSSFGDNMIETVVKGEKGAMTNRDGDWQSLSEIEADTEGFGRFRAGVCGAQLPGMRQGGVDKVFEEGSAVGEARVGARR